MTETISIAAEPREGAGKGPARALRRQGRIPAVVYGDKRDPLHISVDGKTLSLQYHRGGFFGRLCDLSINGETIRVLPRELQLHPVTDVIEHADFLRVGADSQVRVFIPVRFVNEDESPGLRRGGVLAVVRHEIEMLCRAGAIPEAIEFDLSGLAIGDSMHISAVSLPEGVRPTITDRDFTVATIIGAITEAEVEGEEAAEEEEEEAPEAEEGEGGEDEESQA